jgi:hypothetical protein
MGYKTYYLGQYVPLNDLIETTSIRKPHLIITSLTSKPANQHPENYLKKLLDLIPETPIWVSGYQVQDLEPTFSARVRVFHNVLTLKEMLLNLS